MIFRQLYDNTSSTYTYLLADEATLEAIVIDPVFEQHQRDTALLRELGVELKYIVDTHCHADHVTGAWLLRQSHGGKIGLARAVGAEHVDLPLAHGDQIPFGSRRLDVRATPGHTDGCLTLVLDDQSMAFTGDTLLILANRDFIDLWYNRKDFFLVSKSTDVESKPKIYSYLSLTVLVHYRSPSSI